MICPLSITVGLFCTLLLFSFGTQNVPLLLTTYCWSLPTHTSFLGVHACVWIIFIPHSPLLRPTFLQQNSRTHQVVGGKVWGKFWCVCCLFEKGYAETILVCIFHLRKKNSIWWRYECKRRKTWNKTNLRIQKFFDWTFVSGLPESVHPDQSTASAHSQVGLQLKIIFIID